VRGLLGRERGAMRATGQRQQKGVLRSVCNYPKTKPNYGIAYEKVEGDGVGSGFLGEDSGEKGLKSRRGKNRGEQGSPHSSNLSQQNKGDRLLERWGAHCGRSGVQIKAAKNEKVEVHRA